MNIDKNNLPPNFSVEIPEEDRLTRYGKTLGESHIVYASVYVGGKEVSRDTNVEVHITQQDLEHNHFEIICPPDAFNERGEQPLKNSGL